MYANQILQRITIPATETITANQIVALDGTHTVKKGIGVAERGGSSGDAIPVIVSGVCYVMSGELLTAGMLLCANAAGKAIEFDPEDYANDDIVEVIGIAIDNAGSADVLTRVFVAPQAVPGYLNRLTIASGEALTTGCIVAADGTHTVNKGIGVAVLGVTSGNVVVQTNGVMAVISGAAFAVGDKLTADSAGKAVKYDPTNVNLGTVIDIIGTALQQATNTDQSKLVLLSPAVGVGTKALT